MGPTIGGVGVTRGSNWLGDTSARRFVTTAVGTNVGAKDCARVGGLPLLLGPGVAAAGAATGAAAGVGAAAAGDAAAAAGAAGLGPAVGAALLASPPGATGAWCASAATGSAAGANGSPKGNGRRPGPTALVRQGCHTMAFNKFVFQDSSAGKRRTARVRKMPAAVPHRCASVRASRPSQMASTFEFSDL